MIVELAVFVVVFAGLLFAYSLISRRISWTVLTARVFSVAIGILFGPVGIDLLGIPVTSSFVLLLAEAALVITLFADAARIDIRSFGENRRLPGCLLLFGLPLTIGAGVALAALLFTDPTLAEAGLIGAILAPTDAGLGQTIVNNPEVPARIRGTCGGVRRHARPRRYGGDRPDGARLIEFACDVQTVSRNTQFTMSWRGSGPVRPKKPGCGQFVAVK